MPSRRRLDTTSAASKRAGVLAAGIYAWGPGGSDSSPGADWGSVLAQASGTAGCVRSGGTRFRRCSADLDKAQLPHGFLDQVATSCVLPAALFISCPQRGVELAYLRLRPARRRACPRTLVGALGQRRIARRLKRQQLWPHTDMRRCPPRGQNVRAERRAHTAAAARRWL